MTYFIKLEDAKDLRRKLLESSKASIHILRGYQGILEVRGKKLSLMHDLRRELKEITLLLNRVEDLLPELSRDDKEVSLPKLETLPVLPPEPKPVKGRKAKVVPRPAPPKEKKVYIGKKEIVPRPAPHVIPPPVEEEPEPVVDHKGEMTELEQLQAKLASINSRLGKI